MIPAYMNADSLGRVADRLANRKPNTKPLLRRLDLQFLSGGWTAYMRSDGCSEIAAVRELDQPG